MRQTFSIRTREKRQTTDVTAEVRKIVRASGARSGLCHVMVLHATAAIVINENDDPNIGVDLLNALDRTIREHDGWLHDRVDNNAQAHILAATLGPAETIAIDGGDLVLGRWQGIMLVELDGPRERKIAVTVLPAA